MSPRASTRPEADLAEGFARQIGRWALVLGATPAQGRGASEAAHALALATAEGDVCLPLAMLGDPAARRAALLASGVVGSASQPGSRPLVLDDDDRLYLHRYFDYERRLAARLLLARGAAPPAAWRAELDARFGAGGSEPDGQKLAAAMALRGRLAVISGGPGTGKTSTVVALLACLLAVEPDCRIALAAPTGKAAARLAEAIAARAEQLPEAIRARLPRQAATVHRLLEAGRGGFGRSAARPLAIDLLVVDEASMLDLALATRLLEAVPVEARIVLLGDKDQLAAVDAGAVFAELSADASLSDACRGELSALTGIAPERIDAPAPGEGSDAADRAVWLTRNYRFGADSPIARLAAAVNRGDADAALAAAGALVERSDEVLELALAGYAALLRCVRDGAPAAQAHAAFARFRLLAALRDGPRGVESLNERIERRFRAALGALDASPRSPWYPGRPVRVRRNDAALGLYNGDIGIALPGAGAGAIEVVFGQTDGGLRRIAPARLPEHETAFAMTAHQSQGSEFDQVLLVLPDRPHRVLTRELVYTAATRARESIRIAGPAAVLRDAIARPSARLSGLRARLRELAAAG